MAEKLRTFDWKPASKITKPGEKAIYPWEEWLDGDIWQLTEDEDFDTPPLMMERIIRTRATARGAKVRMRHMPKEVNGKRSKHNPFGLIILQRTDVKGPQEMLAIGAEKQAAKAARAAVRAEKKAVAEREAAKTLRQAGIKPTKKVAPVKKTIAKKTAAPTKKAVSKRPSKVTA